MSSNSYLNSTPPTIGGLESSKFGLKLIKADDLGTPVPTRSGGLEDCGDGLC